MALTDADTLPSVRVHREASLRLSVLKGVQDYFGAWQGVMAPFLQATNEGAMVASARESFTDLVAVLDAACVRCVCMVAGLIDLWPPSYACLLLLRSESCCCRLAG
jgi:hypothetical protein